MEITKEKFTVDYKAMDTEKKSDADLLELLKTSSIPNEELLTNLGLFLKRQTLSRILFMHELYNKIINVNGSIVEFGVRWGQNMALFEVLRGIYEPYNYSRKIIGFDTFAGFPSVDIKDGSASCAVSGGYSVTSNYEDELSQTLKLHEAANPIPHIATTSIIKGDATQELPLYLERHPELMVAMVYFDFDIYSPTRTCLDFIKNRLVKGAVVAFDELNHETWPGETSALMEVFDLNKLAIKRSPHCPWPSYFIVGE